MINFCNGRTPQSAHHPHKSHFEHCRCNPGGAMRLAHDRSAAHIFGPKHGASPLTKAKTPALKVLEMAGMFLICSIGKEYWPHGSETV